MFDRIEITDPIRTAGADLREALEGILSEYFGAKRRVARLRRRRSNYSSSLTIENLEVDLDRGRPLKLVFKDLSPASLLTDARNVRPRFLYRPQREIEIYRAVLDSDELGTALCYGALQQSQPERYWLFLERVEGPLLWQVGRFEAWENAARWLGRFHGRFAADTRAGVDRFPAVLLRYDAAHCLQWMERAERFLANRPGCGTDALKHQFRKIAGRYDRVVDRLLEMPTTLIHGEFYPSNIILRKDGDAKRVCPIDWEVAALGPGLIDLAALASGAWSHQEKQRLVKAYHESLPAGTWPPSLGDTLELVEYCQLHLAVQWLGWASDWSPPQGHNQNWLQEIVRLAKRRALIQ